MCAVMAIIGTVIGGLILVFLLAAIKIAGEQSRWEEDYRAKKERKNDIPKKTQGK